MENWNNVGFTQCQNHPQIIRYKWLYKIHPQLGVVDGTRLATSTSSIYHIYIPSRSRGLESPPFFFAVEGSKIIITMILEPWKAIKVEPWNFGYMSLVVVLIPTDHKKRSLIWSAEKGTKSWWGTICTKVQNMFGISIPGFGRSRFPFSKPGDFNVAWFEVSEKRR